MNADELRAIQAPLKERYREAPEAAFITLRANGRVGEGVTCKVETGKALGEEWGVSGLESWCEQNSRRDPKDHSRELKPQEEKAVFCVSTGEAKVR